VFPGGVDVAVLQPLKLIRATKVAETADKNIYYPAPCTDAILMIYCTQFSYMWPLFTWHHRTVRVKKLCFLLVYIYIYIYIYIYTQYFLTLVLFAFCTCCILRCLMCIVVSCVYCSFLCVLLSSYVFLFSYVCIAVFTLDVGLLARSQYSEGPATGHLDTGFS